MAAAVARQVVSASNLANLDTPGYRTREADFGDALDEKGGRGAAGHDRARHLAGAPVADSTASKESAGLQARRDGNTVQLDRELLEMARAGGDFAKAQTALAAKFRLVRYAISEGR